MKTERFALVERTAASLVESKNSDLSTRDSQLSTSPSSSFSKATPQNGFTKRFPTWPSSVGKKATGHSVSAFPELKRRRDTFATRQSIIENARFVKSSRGCCGSMVWNTTNECLIKTVLSCPDGTRSWERELAQRLKRWAILRDKGAKQTQGRA
jgi:hypothetical protein